jgi:AcrR family transcriptional regulator
MSASSRTPRNPSASAPTGWAAGRSVSDDRRGRRQALDEARVRLLVAMVDAIGQDGYRATTVEDVIGRARASRKTFYKHFANKQECFLIAYDAVSARATRHLEEAYSETEGWPQRVQAAIGALFETAMENPAALRLATLEIAAAGPAGIERRERSIELYIRFIRDAATLAPGDGGISETTARAIVGGLYRILHDGRSSRQLGLVRDLAAWAASYYPGPRAIASSRAGGRAPAILEGGRAPGTLAPHSALIDRRGLARGNQNVSPSFVVHSQRERILDAVANLTAENGYGALGVEDIAEAAAVSLKAFYEHFADKEDAFLVAYEVGHTKGLALVERAFFAEPDWRSAVRAGIAALFEFLASEPAFAHMALVEALTATPRTAERSRTGVSDFARMLLPGVEEAPRHARPPAVTIQAIAGGIFELCLHSAVEGRIHQLPELTSDAAYIALAPFIGVDEAARVAKGAG